MHTTTEAALLARTARAQATARAPSLVAGVVLDGRLAWTGGRGRVAGAVPDGDVQYRIGSITKTLTAVLVLRLRDEGAIALDDPVERHLDGVALGGRTVGQLLAHTGGLRAEPAGRWWERSPGVDWDALADTLGDEALVLPAGRRFHYSNLGYAVLGATVARVRGRPWAECLRAEVLEPLGMRRTTVAPAPPSARGYAVHPYADLVLDEEVHATGAMAPAGELWSTVTDLARLAALVLGDHPDVLAPETAEEMRTPAGVDDTRGAWSGYGLGLQVHRDDDRLLIGHGGSMPGFLAGLAVDPAERAGAAMLTNTTSGLDATVLADLVRIAREREPYVAPEWRPATEPPGPILDAVGPWYWGPTPHVLRLAGDGMLELAPTGGGGRPARFRRRDGRWVGRSGYFEGETLTPVRAADGTVTALDVGTFVFTRVPYPRGDVVPGGVPAPGWRPARDDD